MVSNCVILSVALPATVGGWLLHSRRGLLAPSIVEGGDTMVTYSELFSYSLVIIGIIGLVLQITKKK